jgi:hypothetical protein
LSTGTKFGSSNWLVLIDTGRTQITVLRDIRSWPYRISPPKREALLSEEPGAPNGKMASTTCQLSAS